MGGGNPPLGGLIAGFSGMIGFVVAGGITGGAVIGFGGIGGIDGIGDDTGAIGGFGIGGICCCMGIFGDDINGIGGFGAGGAHGIGAPGRLLIMN